MISAEPAHQRTSFPGILFAGLFVFPSLVMVALGQSSMAVGLVVYVALVIVYVVADSLIFRPSSQVPRLPAACVVLVLAVLLFVIGHSSWLFLTQADFQSSRFTGSYLTLMFLGAGAIAYLNRLLTLEPSRISSLVDQAIWFMIVNALIGLGGFDFFKYSSVKPIGVFSEPSHFGLALAPLLAYACANESRHYQFKLLFFFAWAVWIQNMTTLLVVILCFLINVRGRFSSLAILTIIVGAFATIDAEYFITRILVSTDSDNLSVVVLLSGWETAAAMFSASNGWGGGFQQFGFIGPIGELGERVSQMTGESINRYDGGSTAAKLVGEFGVFGIAGLLTVIVLSTKAFFRLRAASRSGESGAILFSLGSVYTLIIELFARGVGYFSPTLFLGACSIILLVGARDRAVSRQLRSDVA